MNYLLTTYFNWSINLRKTNQSSSWLDEILKSSPVKSNKNLFIIYLDIFTI